MERRTACIFSELRVNNSATSSSRGKGKSKKKGSSSESTKVTCPEANKRRKQETAMLDRKGMEELSAWIFSTEQEDYVDGRFTDKQSEEIFRRTCFRCFSETTSSTLGGWVLPKIFDINKEIF